MDRWGTGLLVLSRRGREQEQETEQKQGGSAAQQERALDADSAGER
jgi:hypothetical protein